MKFLFALIPEQERISYAYLLKWIICSIVAGFLGSGLVHLFVWLSTFFSEMLQALKLPLFIWPAAGALLAGGIFYRIERHAAGEGIPSYIQGLQRSNGKLPFSVTFYKFWAALATLSTFGNGGIVGPLGRVCAGIMSSVTGWLAIATNFWTDDDRRTAAICGLAATIGTIFHSSIGGGIFAVEIIQKAKMGYKDLFPGILASASAVFFCKVVGWESFYRFDAVDRFMDLSLIGWLVVLAMLAGGVGGAYTMLYIWIARLFGRRKGNVLLKVVIGSLLSGGIAWVINPELFGTSNGLIDAIFQADYHLLAGRLSTTVLPVGLILIIMLIAKAVCNCITVGSGMSAGFTGPAAIIGMLLGMAMAHFLHIPTGTASYHAFIAAGFAAMMASSMNIPLAAAVMTIELFGLQYSFPAGFSAVIGFQVMRHRTIYDYAVNGGEDGVDDSGDKW
ncbi:MAG: chloride channel protein [Chitinispirillaceae bacterium]|nr:chloride channel protein [Chitinispirillaceae bacterium]